MDRFSNGVLDALLALPVGIIIAISVFETYKCERTVIIGLLYATAVWFVISFGCWIYWNGKAVHTWHREGAKRRREQLQRQAQQLHQQGGNPPGDGLYIHESNPPMYAEGVGHAQTHSGNAQYDEENIPEAQGQEGDGGETPRASATSREPLIQQSIQQLDSNDEEIQASVAAADLSHTPMPPSIVAP